MLEKADQPIEPEEEIKEEETAEPAITLSNEEKDLFARLVEAEAKGESYEGKVAVATVVLNRLESPEFPDSVTNVINEVVGSAYAFSPVQNGEINKPASDDSKKAVDEALTRKDRLQDCIYFYNPEIATDTWITTREVVTTIGNHVFRSKELGNISEITEKSTVFNDPESFPFLNIKNIEKTSNILLFR